MSVSPAASRCVNSQFSNHVTDVRFRFKVDQIGHKWDKSGAFSDQNSVHLKNRSYLSYLGPIWPTFGPNRTSPNHVEITVDSAYFSASVISIYRFYVYHWWKVTCNTTNVLFMLICVKMTVLERTRFLSDATHQRDLFLHGKLMCYLNVCFGVMWF